MYIKNKLLSVAYKIVIVAISTFGVLIQLGVFEGSIHLGTFKYFTVLSNTLTAFYFAGASMYLNRHLSNRGITTWLPPLKGIALMCTTITMVVAHFMLRMSLNLHTLLGLSILIAHYVAPLMAILDWLLFDKKGLMKGSYPLIWIVAPVLYFIFAMIAARIENGIGEGSRYPYPFIDVDILGWGKVLLTALILLVAFIVAGYVFYGLDHGLSRLEKQI